MPLPKPNGGESENDFMKRCMASDMMNSEYPDESQRAAVCHAQFRRRENSMRHVRIKSVEGKWEDKDMPAEELEAWFHENSKDGAVTSEITLFAEAIFKSVEADGVSWVLSDESLDRDMERVDPAGADFKHYKSNPVVLWAHDYTRPAIGKLVNPRSKDGKVTGKVVFDTLDPFAAMIKSKVEQGIISAGSIGFKPNSVEFVEDSKDPTRLIHRKWELMEFSICNVPSNFNALAVREAEPEDTKVTDKDKAELVEAIGRLAAKIEALDAEIKTAQKSKQSYIDSLMRDRDETSPVDAPERAEENTIDRLFAKGEASPSADEKPVQMFGL